MALGRRVLSLLATWQFRVQFWVRSGEDIHIRKIVKVIGSLYMLRYFYVIKTIYVCELAQINGVHRHLASRLIHYSLDQDSCWTRILGLGFQGPMNPN